MSSQHSPRSTRRQTTPFMWLRILRKPSCRTFALKRQARAAASKASPPVSRTVSAPSATMLANVNPTVECGAPGPTCARAYAVDDVPENFVLISGRTVTVRVRPSASPEPLALINSQLPPLHSSSFDFIAKRDTERTERRFFLRKSLLSLRRPSVGENRRSSGTATRCSVEILTD